MLNDLAFADPLKQSAAAALGIDVEALNEFKNKDHVYFRPEVAWDDDSLAEVMTDQEIRDEQFAVEVLIPFNIRTYLQRYGTEAHRDVFGQQFWVDATLPLDFDHTDRFVVDHRHAFPE
jgi:hypothetical protein